MHTVLFCFVLLWLHVLSTFVLYIRCVSSWEPVQSYENPGVTGVTLKVTRKLDHCKPQHFDKAQNVDIILGCVIWHYAITYSNSIDPISDFILIRKKYTKMTSHGDCHTAANLQFNSPLSLLFKKVQFCTVCTRRMFRFSRYRFVRLFRSHQVFPINQKSLSVLKSFSQHFINTFIEACIYLYWGWTRW